MTDARAELREKVADAIFAVWDCPEEDDDRMRVYATAALAVALEEAARVAETFPSCCGSCSRDTAKAIRALIPSAS